MLGIPRPTPGVNHKHYMSRTEKKSSANGNGDKASNAPDGDVTPKILVVEDDPDQCQLICEALRMHYGADPQHIVGVQSAAECLKTDLKIFDVILQDYHLQDMDGLKLTERILARADIPVIFVTGENDSAVAIEAIRHGAQDYIVKLGDYLFTIPIVVAKNIDQHRIKKENQRLRQELEETLSKLNLKNAQLTESLAKLEQMAVTDHLTGLGNRRQLSRILQRDYEEAIRYGFDLTCCMCDLDGYKILNDTLGHRLGDEVLVMTAEVIRYSLRSTDVAARYGGDEFVVVLPHTSLQKGIEVSGRITETLAETMKQNPKIAVPVTMSIGVASIKKDHPTSADSLISMADKALYVAKVRGKNSIVSYGEAFVSQTRG